jgi:hypothetical protein
MTNKKLTGRITPDRIKMQSTPKLQATTTTVKAAKQK